MEKFLIAASPDEINKYLQEGWRVKMFRVLEDEYSGQYKIYSELYIGIPLNHR